MKYLIKSILGRTLFEAEIDCSGDAPEPLKKRLAVLWALKNGADLRHAGLRHADLSGADLCYADKAAFKIRHADLRGADLRYTKLRFADLRFAGLRYADLRGADLRYTKLRFADLRFAGLRYADLRGADLCGAKLRHADLSAAKLRGAKNIILGPQRSDGNLFWLTRDGSGIIVDDGYQKFTFEQARKHCEETHGGTPLGDETMAILDYLETRAPHMIVDDA